MYKGEIMKVLYVDLLCGAAGDMLLAACIDMGFPVDKLREQLGALPVEPIEIVVEKVTRGSILCTQVTPKFGHSHHHRHLDDILNILSAGNVPRHILEMCNKVLDRLAGAEASVHGIPREKVHFHEIGALDTIVDVLGFCMALDHFRIDTFLFSELTDGYGTITAAHGVMPVPVPATAAMIKGYVLRTLPIPTELLTPTGAALCTALGTQKSGGIAGRVTATGYGCGSKNFPEHPNFLRAVILESNSKDISPNSPSNDTVVLLESDMDHISGEIMADTAQKLLAAGALDVSWLPLFMKKGRPGFRLSVIANTEDRETFTDLIIKNSRTLGVRYQTISRTIARRSTVKVPLGSAECSAKVCTHNGYEFSKIEYESLCALSAQRGCSVLDLMDEYVRSTRK